MEGTEIRCEVQAGGRLTNKKGMNLPGVKLSTPALTEKDRRDLAFGVKNGVDYVALSFVRQAADVSECKALVKSLGGTCPVIAKIEKREAIDNLTAILEATDGVMVARGDLGSVRRKKCPPCRSGSSRWRTRRQGGHHRHPDAGEHGREPAAHLRRGFRRRQRHPDGTDGIMLGGDGVREVPDRGPWRPARIAVTLKSTTGLPPARPRRIRQACRRAPRAWPARWRKSWPQAHHRLHGVGHHRPPPVHLSVARPIAAVTYNPDTYRRLPVVGCCR